MLAYNLLHVLHLLGAVIWVGGMAFMLLALRPAMAVLEPPQRLALHRGVLKRFFLLVWHAMPILLVTGYAMLFGWLGGFAGVGWNVHVMHLTGLLMSGIYLFIFFGPFRALKTAEGPAAVAALGRIRQLVTLNFALGVLTVVVAAWGVAGD